MWRSPKTNLAQLKPKMDCGRRHPPLSEIRQSPRHSKPLNLAQPERPCGSNLRKSGSPHKSEALGRPPLKTSDRTVNRGARRRPERLACAAGFMGPTSDCGSQREGHGRECRPPLLRTRGRHSSVPLPTPSNDTDAASTCIANDLDGASPTP
jgi:hypothetical protein